MARVPAWRKGLVQWSPQPDIAARISSQLPRTPCQESRAKNPATQTLAENSVNGPAPPTSDRLEQPGARDLLRPFPAALTTKIRSPHRRPCHSMTFHISPMHRTARFDRMSTLRLEATESAARSRAPKTRMNAAFSRQVETHRHVSIDARPLFMRGEQIPLA